MMFTCESHAYSELYSMMYGMRSEPHCYVAYVRGNRCVSDEQFHAEIAAALQFPPYYGSNHNALSDCLEDLEWLNASQVVVVIDNAEQFILFDQNSNNVYRKSLERAVKYWQKEEMEFRVVLNFSNKQSADTFCLNCYADH